jgi:hypothetical protein
MVAKQAGVLEHNGVEPSYDRVVSRAPGSHRIAGAVARVLPDRLDRALIAGSDPAASDQLAARAAALTSRRFRTLLADGLERMPQAAEREPGRLRVRPRRHVLANATALLELAELLRSAAPLYASGIALANRLLTDGTGPAYAGDGAELTSLLARARTAMCAGEVFDVAPVRARGVSPARGPQIELDPEPTLRGGPR